MRKDVRAKLQWRGNGLCLARRCIVTIEQDAIYPTMWRVRYPDGALSDMVNLARARDAARSIAAAILEGRDSGARAPPMR